MKLAKTINITADDFGLTSSINEGIALLATTSKINNVSVMCHSQTCQNNFDILLANHINMGAHITLTEFSFRSNPIFFFQSYTDLFCSILFGKLSLVVLEAEIRAQLEWYLQNELPLTFINSHQHVHMFPLIWPIFCKLCKEFKIPFIRSAPFLSLPFGKYNFLKNAAWVSSFLEQIPKCQLINPIGLEYSGKLHLCSEEYLIKEKNKLIKTSQNIELISHPGKEDSNLKNKFSHWQYNWQKELEFLQQLELNY